MKRQAFGIVAAMLLAACTSAATPAPTAAPQVTAAPPTAAPTASEWDKIVAAAKTEGTVIVWGQPGTSELKFQKEAFETANPGIKVDLFQAASSGDRDTRFQTEFKGGVAKVDVLIGGAGANTTLKPAGMLQDVNPFLVLPEVKDTKNWMNNTLLWQDTELKFGLQSDASIYAPLVVGPSVDISELKNWEDLLNAKWKGKIVMGDPRMSGAGFATGLFFYYSPGLGPTFTQKFWSESGVAFAQDARTNLESVVSGKYLISINHTASDIDKAQKDGLQFKIVTALNAGGKPANALGSTIGLFYVPNLNPLPHPNATKVYLNWMLSKAGQQAMVDIMLVGSRRLDVDQSKIPAYARPDQTVAYLNRNAYAAADQTKAMRDDVTKYLPTK